MEEYAAIIRLISMRRYKTLILFIFALIPLTLSAQNADQRINELLGSGDWFALNREYSEIKDSVQSDVLKSMAETMLAAYFNCQEELGGSLTALIDNHSEGIGLQNVCNMLMLGAIVEGSNGRYALAADMVKSVIERITAAGGSIEGTGLDVTYEYYNAVRELPAPSITMRRKSVKVPFFIKDIPASESASEEMKQRMTGKSNVIWLPVFINGKKYEFILDTGASYSALSKSFAEEIGAGLVRDTIDLHGANHSGGTRTQRALIRQMNIGGMKVNNILAYVLSDNQLDTLVCTDAILGMDFLKLAGNISIDFKRNTVTLGRTDHKSNGHIPNLYIEPNNTLCLSANINSEPQNLKLDTGCTMTDLSYIWYSSHKDNVADLNKSNVLLGTYGSTEKKGLLSMPEVSFEVDGKEALVHNVLIHTTPDGNQHSGTVGLELLRKFNKVNINLQNMTLTVE